MKTMGAGKFKAHCLALMHEVKLKREPVLLTKKGKPVEIAATALNPRASTPYKRCSDPPRRRG